MNNKRILLQEKVREKVFLKLKDFFHVKSYKELSNVLGVNYSSLNKWIYGDNYIPIKIFPNGLIPKEFIVDIKNENWGRSKGGKIGIKRMREIYYSFKKEYLIKDDQKIEKITGKRFLDYNKIAEKIKVSKLQKTRKLIEYKINKNINFFSSNDFPLLNTTELINYIKNIKNDVVLPRILDENLAEEIGIHIGDGTLVESRNYYSLRGYSIDEYEYYLNHVSKLIENVYGFKPKIFKRKNVCGFEKYSKLIFDFKTKIISLSHGKKSHIIDIPNIIKNTYNEKLISLCIRGILDSDGCIWFLN